VGALVVGAPHGSDATAGGPPRRPGTAREARGQGWPQAIAKRREAPLMPRLAVLSAPDRVTTRLGVRAYVGPVR
jgi:hypothetical protein